MRLSGENVGGALFLCSGQHLKLMLLRGDDSAAGADIGVRLCKGRGRLFEPRWRVKAGLWIRPCWRSYSCCASTWMASADARCASDCAMVAYCNST